MSFNSSDWMKVLGAAALALTGAGLAGAGPLAASLGGSAAAGAGTGAAAGAAGTAGATGAGGALSAMTPAMAELSAASGGAATGALGTASPIVGNMLIGQSAGLGISAAQPKYDIEGAGTPAEMQGMDLNALLEKKQQSQLPKLNLGLRRS